jgi:hypothetical protein
MLKQHIQHQSWSLLPEHEYIDVGISGARLDRRALDRLPDAARRGELKPNNRTSQRLRRNNRNCSSDSSGASVKTNACSMPIRPRFST